MRGARATAIAAACALALLGSACASRPAAAGSSGEIVHLVIAWQKAPRDAAQRAQLIEASRGLLAIPGVLALEIGEVVESERAVVEDSYDLALSLRFAGEAELAAYLVHPEHLRLVREELAPLLSRYQVIDYRVK